MGQSQSSQWTNKGSFQWKLNCSVFVAVLIFSGFSSSTSTFRFFILLLFCSFLADASNDHEKVVEGKNAVLSKFFVTGTFPNCSFSSSPINTRTDRKISAEDNSYGSNSFIREKRCAYLSISRANTSRSASQNGTSIRNLFTKEKGALFVFYIWTKTQSWTGLKVGLPLLPKRTYSFWCLCVALCLHYSCAICRNTAWAAAYLGTQNEILVYSSNHTSRCTKRFRCMALSHRPWFEPFLKILF